MSSDQTVKRQFADWAVPTFAFAVLVGLCLFAIWDVAWTLSYNSANAERYAEHHSANVPEQIQERCFLPATVAVECIREIVASSREHERAEADLRAQLDMAKWALWMVIVSGATLGITAIGVWYVRQTLREAQLTTIAAVRAADAATATNDISKSAFLSDQRPWINVDVTIVSDVTFDKSGMKFKIKINTENVGRSPATGVFVVTSVDVEEIGRFKDLKTKMMTFWIGQNNLRMLDPNNWGLSVGDVVFPGEDRVRETELFVPREKLEVGMADGRVMPGIIVACTYGPEPTGKYYSTVRMFHLNGPGDTRKVTPIPLLDTGAIPRSAVNTSRTFSAAYAV